MDIADIYAAIRSLWVVWMVALFVGIVAWAMWPRNKAKFDDAASIPLRDDDQEK